MTTDEILDALRAIVRDELAVEVAIDPATELAADLGLDSMAATVLVIAIEDRFRIVLPDAELAAARRVDDVVALIARHAGGRAAC